MFALALLATSAFAQNPPSPQAPRITFSAQSITASGIVPGGRAVFYGVGIAAQGYDLKIMRFQRIVSDASRSGVVMFDLGQAVPVNVIWAIVDLTDGKYAVSRLGGPVAETKLPPNAFRRAGAQIDTFAFDHPVLDLLYVHPGQGAWTWSTAEGAIADRDKTGARTSINLADGHSLDDNPNLKPIAFVPGGVVVAIDWYKMQVVSVRLDANALGGGQ